MGNIHHRRVTRRLSLSLTRLFLQRVVNKQNIKFSSQPQFSYSHLIELNFYHKLGSLPYYILSMNIKNDENHYKANQQNENNPIFYQ